MHVLAIPISKRCRSLRPSPEMLVILLVEYLEGFSGSYFVVDLARDWAMQKEKRPFVDKGIFSPVDSPY